MAVLLARVRMPFLWAAVVFLVVGAVVGLPWWPPVVVLLAAFAVYFRIGTVRRPPVEVGFPVRGRYRAINSPADKVPSHGLHAYGQTYAVDLKAVPTGEGKLVVETTPLTRPPTDYPGFGEPLLSPVDGVVVRAHDRQRDHRSRMSWAALVWMLTVEAFARELRGTKGILGNHVVIRSDDGGAGGVYVALAHVRQGSLRVAEGDRVRRGQIVAALGNSGSSSEPHVHVQVMDHPSIMFAAGLPMAFPGHDGVPGSEHPFVAA